MPKPYPQEFRDDVVRVARKRDAEVTLEQIASDFGIHAVTSSKWLRQAAIDDGDKRGITSVEAKENEVLRGAAAYLSQANLSPTMIFPVVRDLADDRILVTVTCRVL